VGFARANNAAIRATRGELVLLLNSDTVVPPGAIDRMIAILESRADVAAMGPKLIDTDGRAELSFGRMMSPLNEMRQKALGRLTRSGGRLAMSLLSWLTGAEREVDWVSGACLLVRREDAEAVGLLDERYFMYAEDVDFCAALRARRRRVLFTPAVEVVHKRGRSRAAAPEATRRAYRRSQLAFYAKHHPRWAPLLTWYLRRKGEA
jgi:GT2 family glycosyltransferase